MAKIEEKLNVKELLKGLEDYRPRRKGWTWRKKTPELKMGPFNFKEVSEPLEK